MDDKMPAVIQVCPILNANILNNVQKYSTVFQIFAIVLKYNSTYLALILLVFKL